MKEKPEPSARQRLADLGFRLHIKREPLTGRQMLANLAKALSEHDSDCASLQDLECDCGADDFREKFVERFGWR